MKAHHFSFWSFENTTRLSHRCISLSREWVDVMWMAALNLFKISSRHCYSITSFILIHWFTSHIRSSESLFHHCMHTFHKRTPALKLTFPCESKTVTTTAKKKKKNTGSQPNPRCSTLNSCNQVCPPPWHRCFVMNVVADDWSQDCCSCKNGHFLPHLLQWLSGKKCDESRGKSIWHVTVFNTFVYPTWLAASQLLSFSVATLKFEHIQENFHNNQYYRTFGHGVECYKSMFYLPGIHFSYKIVYIISSNPFSYLLAWNRLFWVLFLFYVDESESWEDCSINYWHN